MTPGSAGFIVLLGALSALAPVAIDMNLPALPRLTAVFATSPDRVQLTLSVFLLGFAVGQLAYGPVSDRFGRRRVLLVGLALFAASGFACATAASIGQLVLFRLLQGLGACVGPVIARAIVRDLFHREMAVRLMSYIALVLGLAPLLAPLVGGYLLVLAGWRVIFVTQGVAAMALLAATWWWLEESLATRDATATSLAGMARSYHRFVTTAASLRYAVMVATVFAGMFAYISNSPFVLIQVFGIPSDGYGYFFAMTALALMTGAFLNGRLVRRFAPETLLTAGIACVAVGSVAIIACAATARGGVAGVMAPMVVYVFGYGLVAPNATAGALEPHPRMAGVASSLLGCFQMAGGAVAGYAVNALYRGTPLAMASIVAGMGVLTTALHVGGTMRRRSHYAHRGGSR